MSTTTPTRAARQAKILEILSRNRVSSQVELSELLLGEVEVVVSEVGG